MCFGSIADTHISHTLHLFKKGFDVAQSLDIVQCYVQLNRWILQCCIHLYILSFVYIFVWDYSCDKITLTSSPMGSIPKVRIPASRMDAPQCHNSSSIINQRSCCSVRHFTISNTHSLLCKDVWKILRVPAATTFLKTRFYGHKL